MPEPKDGSGECDDGEVVSGGFVEARRDASQLFELAGAAFDEVAPGVEVLVHGMPQRAGRIVGDDGDRLAEVVGVAGRVGHHRPGGEPQARGASPL